jgi:hypothetical protein
VTGGKPIAALLQSISGVIAINPLVAFYDFHGGKREVLFFYFVPDTTREVPTIEFFKKGNRKFYYVISHDVSECSILLLNIMST